MTLPASGALTFAQIQTEIGDANATLTIPDANTRTLTGKSSGALILPDDFWGKSWFTNTLRSYTTGSSATETAPTGCVNVVIEIWGCGGSGGPKTGTGCTLVGGAGGGGGGYSRTSVAITGGQTLTYTVGQPSGNPSSCSSGTKTITTMTGNGGGGGTASSSGGVGGSGGTASGGTAVNTAGQAGSPGDAGGGGFGGGTANGLNGNNPATNGLGADGTLTVGGRAAVAGRILFYYT